MWHIKTGEYILDHGSIPRDEDPFSFADDEVSSFGNVILSQYWLAQIILFKIYQNFGPIGLVLTKAMIFTLIAFVLWLIIMERGFYASLAVIGTISLYLIPNYSSVRPQVLTFLFSALLLFLIERNRETANSRYLFPMPLMMLVWANMHGGFIFGIVIILLYIVGEFLGRRLSDTSRNSAMGAKHFNLFVGISLLSILLSGINPNGYRLFLHAVYTHSPIYSYIAEYRTFIAAINDFRLTETILYLAGIIISILLAVYFIKKRRFPQLFLLVLTAIMSLMAVRYIPLFAIVLTATLRYVPVTPEKLISERLGRILDGAVAVLLLVLVFTAQPFRNEGIYKFQNSFTYPVKAVNFMSELGISGNIFASYNKSGYVLFGTHPDSRIYIDGRNTNLDRLTNYALITGYMDSVEEVLEDVNEILPENLGRLTLRMEDTQGNLLALKGKDKKPGWKELLNEIEAEIIVTEAVNVFTGEIYPLVFKLISDDSWKLVYLDGTVMILLKDLQKFEKVIADYEIPKRLIFDEIISESQRVLSRGRPEVYTSMALGLLLKGVAGNETRELIDKALASNPNDLMVIYCEAIYKVLNKKS